MRILQTRPLKQAAKRLHASQKAELDDAVRQIAADPGIGDAKVGDLVGVRVFKFRIDGRLALLAYSHDEDGEAITLLALGSHQNFYRDLKR
jgi:mRNA interferase RelE/StbE